MNREAERQRLVELLNKKCDHFCDQCGVNKDSHYTDSLADYLLDNGVIVPKYEIGQKIYTTTPHGIYHSSYEICGIQFTDELRYIYCDVCDGDLMSFGEEDVGKTIFFSVEALANGFKEYARQLRENAVKDAYGYIICSPELWEELASIIESFSQKGGAE